ncbi:MAG: glycosyltransferase family 2 protein, partial [Lachnospiraceae bacterium]|nr:glycosyltransferase family 2 protein [Lachnospiraceae bacterium]
MVPAYNAEKTLARTIESILHQTDDRYKLILVNDGSTDRTDEICQSYLAEKNDKIRYIPQENRGLGGARNTGLRFVDTPYVSFLDSDDWLMPQYVEKLIWHLDRHKGENIEMIMTLPQIFHEGSRAVRDWYDKDLFDEIFTSEGEIINPGEKEDIYRFEVNQCRKVLHMDFVKRVNFSFREKIKWEDVYPHFYLLSQCTACMGISEIGFYYRIGSSSQITASRGADRLDLLIVFEDLLQYIN